MQFSTEVNYFSTYAFFLLLIRLLIGYVPFQISVFVQRHGICSKYPRFIGSLPCRCEVALFLVVVARYLTIIRFGISCPFVELLRINALVLLTKVHINNYILIF